MELKNAVGVDQKRASGERIHGGVATFKNDLIGPVQEYQTLSLEADARALRDLNPTIDSLEGSKQSHRGLTKQAKTD